MHDGPHVMQRPAVVGALRVLVFGDFVLEVGPLLLLDQIHYDHGPLIFGKDHSVTVVMVREAQNIAICNGWRSFLKALPMGFMPCTNHQGLRIEGAVRYVGASDRIESISREEPRVVSRES